MATLLKIDDDILVNVEQVVKAEFVPSDPGGEEFLDEDSGQTRIAPPRRAALTLTLTARVIEHAYDHEGNITGTAATSDTLRVRGQAAEVAWERLLAGAIA